MKEQYDVNALCVEVFSKISATVTHEIKNTLSIINENAGFLEDLAVMAGDDGSVPSERIGGATKAIEKQVIRSNIIMRNLNQFSHSRDTTIRQANLQELLQLMIELTSRQAASHSVDVRFNCRGDITINTSLLPLEALLFYILDSLYSATGTKTTLCIDACVINSDAQITFSDREEQTNAFEKYQPGAKEQILAEAIDGTCSINESTIVLLFACNKNLK